jgi:hypothetical protein
MKNLEGTNSDIFNLVKKEKEVEYSGLHLRLKTSDLRIRESISKLKTEYGLISVINRKISLTEKGEKFNNFESYLESLNKNPLNWYKIVPIILTIVFGSISFYFLKANYDLKVSESNLIKTNDSLTNDNENLKSELLIHKDSVAELKEQLRLLKLKPSESTVIAKKKND